MQPVTKTINSEKAAKTSNKSSEYEEKKTLLNSSSAIDNKVEFSNKNDSSLNVLRLI
jgi:hypothetical protein